MYPSNQGPPSQIDLLVGLLIETWSCSHYDFRDVVVYKDSLSNTYLLESKQIDIYVYVVNVSMWSLKICHISMVTMNIRTFGFHYNLLIYIFKMDAHISNFLPWLYNFPLVIQSSGHITWAFVSSSPLQHWQICPM